MKKKVKVPERMEKVILVNPNLNETEKVFVLDPVRDKINEIITFLEKKEEK